MDFLVVLAILTVVVFVITAPLRRDRQQSGRSGELAELEAARDSKYREIRDAELDRATGKLSDEDFDAVHGRLRSEAVQILDAIERTAAVDPRGGVADE